MHRFFNRTLCFVALMAVAIGLVLPTQPVLADIPATDILTLDSSDFNNGRFSLTGLTVETNGIGGVQLIPEGTMKQWIELGTNLMCQPVSNMAYASYNNHIYSIGGETQDSPSDPVEFIDSICHTEVTDQVGTLAPWQTITPSTVSGQTGMEPRSSASAVAVAAPGDTQGRGIMIVAGGYLDGFSQNNVWSSVINSDGSLSAWRSELDLSPIDMRDSMGIASYTSPTTGKTFIYVVGGIFQNPTPILYRSVLRAEVLGINGDDMRLSAWVNIGNMPVPSLGQTATCQERIGIYGNKVVTMEVLTDPSSDVLVSMGGLAGIGEGSADANCPSTAFEPISAVYFATFDPDTGNLTWNTTTYNLPLSMSQLGAISINGKIYTAGGATGNDQSQATNLVMSTYMTPTLPLDFVSYADSNFLQSPTAVLPAWARLGHGMVLIENNGRPVTYMFGGKSSDGVYHNNTFRGYVGLPEDLDFTQKGYASPGLYESEKFELAGPGAVTRMQWSTSLPTGYTTDVEVSYKIASTLNELKTTSYISLDADPNTALHSVDGINNYVFPEASLIGKYFQYKAVLRTDTPDESDATPIFKGKVEIDYVVDGYPNLVGTSAVITNISAGSIPNANLTIGNQRPASSGETLLDADLESEGTFFVYLYAYEPNQPVISPTKDISSGDYLIDSHMVAFAEVNRAELPADSFYPIPQSSWKMWCSTAPNCIPANWKLIFNQQGLWNAIMVVDGGNDVTEADAPDIDWETDNTFPFQVQSDFTGEGTYLPIVRRFVPPTP